MPARRRIDFDPKGSMKKSYKDDSWVGMSPIFDAMGNQRTPDVDNDEFYTLGGGGMIDAMIEHMEQFDAQDGGGNPSSSDAVSELQIRRAVLD